MQKILREVLTNSLSFSFMKDYIRSMATTKSIFTIKDRNNVEVGTKEKINHIPRKSFVKLSLNYTIVIY